MVTLNSRRKRFQRPVFWGSILLNVVLIGLFLFGSQNKLPHHPLKPEVFLQHIGQNLTGSDKVIFVTALAKHAPKIEQQGQGVYAALEAIVAEVKKEPFSMEALDQAHQKLNSRKAGVDRQIAAFVMDVVGGLSPEGRKRLKLMPHKETK